MTEKDRIVLATFEEKLHRLVYEHRQLKEANQELSRTLKDKENSLAELQQRCSALESSYNDLKQAKIISLTGEGIDEARDRISRLVREIDRCIESLKK
ncbi:MAG: hypothetical protein IKJ61_04690 [Bacteroidaceae bacterium]|nr:hypothetical protein [Bacteroidaceae bacterium]MBR3907382.1 hypothetical protein [Bacteroidaceae bacterium]